MPNGESVEPIVITKPETPFYRSPKLLAVFAIFFVIGLGMIFVRYAPDLLFEKPSQPIQVYTLGV